MLLEMHKKQPNIYLWDLYTKFGGDFLSDELIIFKDGTSVEYLGHDRWANSPKPLFRINYANPDWGVQKVEGRLPMISRLPFEVKGRYSEWTLH